jgi:uncharacterized protein (DUF58 family)
LLRRTALLSAFAFTLAAAPAAAEVLVFRVTIEDGKFTFVELRAPADKAFTLVVKNAQPTAIEFESKKLKLEKVIAAGAEQSLQVRPLKPGSYLFVDEFNEDTAKGNLIVE